MPLIQLPDFMAITFGLITYLLGEAINDRVPVLRRFNIPDPVTGGLLVALGFFALERLGIAEVSFDTHSRDLLLLVFFTGIGLNARIADLLKGGKPSASWSWSPPRCSCCRTSSAASAPGSPACPSAWVWRSAPPRSSAATAR